jgi:hypothetical protein
MGGGGDREGGRRGGLVERGGREGEERWDGRKARKGGWYLEDYSSQLAKLAVILA